MFKIEKNIAMPENKITGKYPLKTMKVGDSFLIPKTTNPNPSLERSRVGSAVQTLKRAVTGDFQGFSIRTVPEDDGLRVWRVK